MEESGWSDDGSTMTASELTATHHKSAELLAGWYTLRHHHFDFLKQDADNSVYTERDTQAQ